MNISDPRQNPLLSADPAVWRRLIDAVSPASLLVVIDDSLPAGAGPRLTAVDVLQAAVLQAWRERRHCGWTGVRAFRAWLLSIVRERLGSSPAGERSPGRDRARRIGAAPPEPCADRCAPDVDPVEDADHLIPPDRLARYRADADAMRAALATLPPDMRTVVSRRLFEQEPMECIARDRGGGAAAALRSFRQGVELYCQALARERSTRHGRTGMRADARNGSRVPTGARS